MSRVRFEITMTVFERAKTVHALDRAATVIGWYVYNRCVYAVHTTSVNSCSQLHPISCSTNFSNISITFKLQCILYVTKLTPWSWALLEKPPVVQLPKNFPAFYATRRFITVFARTLRQSLAWARSIQSIPPHPISLRSILIWSTPLRLGLPNGLFPSGFHTNILYAFFFSHILAKCLAYLIIFALIILIILGEEYKLWSSSLCSSSLCRGFIYFI
jgi:hypothetical protein